MAQSGHKPYTGKLSHCFTTDLLEILGMINCFSRVWSEEGPRALWRGNLANIIRYFPTQAISLSVKDKYQGADFYFPEKAYYSKSIKS